MLKPLCYSMEYQMISFTCDLHQLLHDVYHEVWKLISLQQQRWQKDSIIAHQLYAINEFYELMDIVDKAVFSYALMPSVLHALPESLVVDIHYGYRMEKGRNGQSLMKHSDAISYLNRLPSHVYGRMKDLLSDINLRSMTLTMTESLQCMIQDIQQLMLCNERLIGTDQNKNHPVLRRDQRRVAARLQDRFDNMTDIYWDTIVPKLIHTRETIGPFINIKYTNEDLLKFMDKGDRDIDIITAMLQRCIWSDIALVYRSSCVNSSVILSKVESIRDNRKQTIFDALSNFWYHRCTTELKLREWDDDEEFYDESVYNDHIAELYWISHEAMLLLGLINQSNTVISATGTGLEALIATKEKVIDACLMNVWLMDRSISLSSRPNSLFDFVSNEMETSRKSYVDHINRVVKGETLEIVPTCMSCRDTTIHPIAWIYAENAWTAPKDLIRNGKECIYHTLHELFEYEVLQPILISDSMYKVGFKIRDLCNRAMGQLDQAISLNIAGHDTVKEWIVDALHIAKCLQLLCQCLFKNVLFPATMSPIRPSEVVLKDAYIDPVDVLSSGITRYSLVIYNKKDPIYLRSLALVIQLMSDSGYINDSSDTQNKQLTYANWTPLSLLTTARQMMHSSNQEHYEEKEFSSLVLCSKRIAGCAQQWFPISSGWNDSNKKKETVLTFTSNQNLFDCCLFWVCTYLELVVWKRGQEVRVNGAFVSLVSHVEDVLQELNSDIDYLIESPTLSSSYLEQPIDQSRVSSCIVERIASLSSDKEHVESMFQAVSNK